MKHAKKIVCALENFLSDEEAPTMVEYGLLVAVIALIVVAGAALFGTKLSTYFATAANSLT